MLGEPQWLPRWCHRLAWRLMSYLFIAGNKSGKRDVVLEQLPECDPDDLIGNLEQDSFEVRNCVEPLLFGVSPSLGLQREDWPCKPNLTGFWVVSTEEQQRKMLRGDKMFGGAGGAEELKLFLQNGATPIYIGWGSMLAISQEHMACLAVRSLMKAGLRGIVLGGWAELCSDHLGGQPDSKELLDYASHNVLFIQSAPHEWLFPQCAAIVHHGGSGTTAAALRSGRPSIITPCGFDQFANAEMVANSGTGIALGQIGRVLPQNLADAMVRALHDAELVTRAAEVGRRLHSEDGLGNAIKVIDEFITQDLTTGVWRSKRAHLKAELRKLSKPSFLTRLGYLCSDLCVCHADPGRR